MGSDRQRLLRIPVHVQELCVRHRHAGARDCRTNRADCDAIRCGSGCAGWRSAAWLYAAPWLLAVLPYNRLENRGALVAIEYLTLVRRMLVKTQATDALERGVHAVVGADPNYRVLLTVASILFLIGGLGARCLGVWPVLQAAIARRSMRRWTILAWIVILGIAAPFVVSIAPFPNSIQTYEFGLFALWPFTALIVWPEGAAVTGRRLLATALLVAVRHSGYRALRVGNPYGVERTRSDRPQQRRLPDCQESAHDRSEQDDDPARRATVSILVWCRVGASRRSGLVVVRLGRRKPGRRRAVIRHRCLLRITD